MAAIAITLILLTLFLLFVSWTYRTKAPQFAKCSRSCQRYLFRALWKEGYYPEVEYVVGKIEIDIAFPYSKVAIFCGWNNWEATDLEWAKCRKKERLLREMGWKVIRLSPREIYQRPKVCVQKIEQNLSMAKLIF
ncbi:hypothetical protein [Ammoniphilus sp. YIM 78166]|uniref:hypothetical protein n=1 Tax=Ammoniphilus sp. YIM 78166 TaxID=1644106 RepID=UPI00106F70F2|nr:hypothetical protein [Ammoniphilus sp. YIM 78166]